MKYQTCVYYLRKYPQISMFICVTIYWHGDFKFKIWYETITDTLQVASFVLFQIKILHLHSIHLIATPGI